MYVNDEEQIKKNLMPRISSFVKYFIFNKGSVGIRVSTFLSILQPKKYSQFAMKIVNMYLLRRNSCRNKQIKVQLWTSIFGF